jgi:imidazolonepropionase
VQPVLLPGSVFALGRTKYPPARAMVEMGLAIVRGYGLQSGFVADCVDAVHAFAGLFADGLTPAEALTAATINAAWSLGLGGRVGSLESGKQADFLIHEFDDYRELAYFISPLSPPR